MNQIISIKNKLDQLKSKDTQFSIFGASKHRYQLGDKLSPQEISTFEKKHNITLPEGLKFFLLEIGNGGAGPFYGLEPLENFLFEDLDYKRGKLNPSKPFQHATNWNMDFKPSVSIDDNYDKFHEELEQHEHVYFSSEFMNGAIAICNYGCGVILHLVVNGEEQGNIWTDDRGSDGGIYPSIELGNKNRIQFLDWYERWLDKSIKEVESFPSSLIAKPSADKSSPNKWWEFWK